MVEVFYRTKSEVEKNMGIKYYSTPMDINLTGFYVKKKLGDFVVHEILRGKIILPVKKVGKIYSPVEDEKGKYLRIVLVKKGVDTFSLLNFISRKFNVPLSEIGFLGLKDARGITSQVISIIFGKNGMSFDDVKEIKKMKSIKMLNVYRSCAPVTSHELFGNKFTIILRGREDAVNDDFIHNIIILQKLLQNKSLPSYFGYQRFGLKPPFNHIIGKSIIREENEKVIKLMLMKKEERGLDKNFTYENFGFDYEDYLIKVLEKGYEKNTEKIEELPKIVIRFFVQAYQSFLFNEMINMRIVKDISLTYPIVGDIVGPYHSTILKNEDIIVVTDRNIDKINDMIRKGIFTVIYPLPGYLVDIMKKPIGDAYEPIAKIMDSEKINFQNFLLKEIPEISLAGYYRPLTFRVYDFILCETKNCKITCSFTLKKGFYATLVLRELIKPEKPQDVGF
ncbi:MAG: tRNA pseudouridine(13) synthase TruD [Candidatus Methanomethylicia archaeon]|nr:tRNA pseudouridine(13) synthase TruD [Candidatus Methanomethylicia archaeon]MCX8169323.1 tRNA pseudouridine(13) synthase TruD [Candidatus Methanomethylicia archaeon]MDW7988894.1 tRNA pseudouridine(13) synthase TruD [Nitrososphaerota archaeon]